jgi:hypothetical protein
LALVVLAEEESVLRDAHDRGELDEELEDVVPDSAEDGHPLQELDARRVHAGVPIGDGFDAAAV